MTQAWYQAASLAFGVLSAVIIMVIVLAALRKYLRDRALWRRVHRHLPKAGAAGMLTVLEGGRRLSEGDVLRVPYEGTLGAGYGCDVRMPLRGVPLRAAYFWLERDGLHLIALHRAGFRVDDLPVGPGDEAVVGDGAVLRVGGARVRLSLFGGVHAYGQEGSDGFAKEREA